MFWHFAHGHSGKLQHSWMRALRVHAAPTADRPLSPSRQAQEAGCLTKKAELCATEHRVVFYDKRPHHVNEISSLILRLHSKTSFFANQSFLCHRQSCKFLGRKQPLKGCQAPEAKSP